MESCGMARPFQRTTIFHPENVSCRRMPWPIMNCAMPGLRNASRRRVCASTLDLNSSGIPALLQRRAGFHPERIIRARMPSEQTMSGFSFQTASSGSTFMQGTSWDLLRIRTPALISIKERTLTPRAAGEDVPAFKGFPPMTSKPKWFWRILACIPYLMPLSETWMYAETAYSLFAFLEDYEFCTYPFLILIGSLPGWFLLAYFFGAYLGIVRNNRWPHFLRFHVVTGMLLEIILQVMGTINDWVPQSVYWGKIGAHYWLAVATAFLFIVLDCIRCALNGMYADVPFLSDASYMQIPYE